MNIPEKIPGLRSLIIVWAGYAAVWITLEGALMQAVLLGLGTTAVVLAYLTQKYLSGRRVSFWLWLGWMAGLGLGLGLGSSLLTVVFMAVKTGLHAHGPEFRADEITWVISQLPRWTAVGLLAGLGLGMLIMGGQREE